MNGCYFSLNREGKKANIPVTNTYITMVQHFSKLVIQSFPFFVPNMRVKFLGIKNRIIAFNDFSENLIFILEVNSAYICDKNYIFARNVVKVVSKRV